MFNLLFGATQDNDAAAMHMALTNVIQEYRGAVTATLELDDVEKVRTGFGIHPFIFKCLLGAA